MLLTTSADDDERFSPFPLRDVQEAYWLGRAPGLVLGNVAAYGYYEYETDSVDVETLRASLQRVIERHDMLRTILLPDGQQRVLDPAPLYEIAVHDLRSLSPASIDERIAAIRSRLSHQMLPYDRWPLFTLEASLLPDGRVRLHVGVDFIICDAWSFRLVMRELLVFFDDPAAALPVPGLTFRQYVLRERQLQDSDAYRKAWEYWSCRVEEMPAGPALPLGMSPERIEQPRFRRLTLDVEPERWRRIKQRAGSARLTPTTVLLALYADVLALYSGESRFTINLTLFSRMSVHPDVERIVGDFTSLVPLVVAPRLRSAFVERAGELQQQLWKDIDHRLVSGPRIMRERTRRSGARRTALLPVVFTSLLGMEETLADSRSGRRLTGTFSISHTPQVWLDFIVIETAGTLRCMWQYVDGLFPDEIIGGLYQSFCAQLDRLTEDDWSALDRIETLPAHLDARNRLIVTGAVPDLRLEQLFLHQAAVAGERPAVITPDRIVSYRELERRSAAVANVLLRSRMPPERVAVVMEKGWEQIVGVLGVLRAGAAYVPIDPALPAERVLHLLTQSRATQVLTQSQVVDGVRWPDDVQPLVVDRVLPLAEGETIGSCGSADDLAYIIYTSGSTGLPKGVMISHRGAVNTILEINRLCAVTARDRVLCVSSLSFDLSVYDIFGLLAAGGAVVMPKAANHSDPSHWLDLIGRTGVTLWNSVPALLQIVLESGFAAAANLETLRAAMLSGDWIPVSLPGRLRQVAPSARVLGMGGATEASIWSIYKWVDAVDPAWTSIPYGRPLINQYVQVLDSDLRQCPVWTTGELYIGGAGVALGYWDDDERTSASFITHPRTGERLYRTGDFARTLPDGEIEFLGRRDNQVKLAGHRIEFGEIEYALLRHPDIQSCVAAVVGHDRERRSLAAYIVLAPGAALAADQVREYLTGKLPAFMVPHHVVILEHLPLTANGKINRAALPAPAEADEAKQPHVAPGTPLEEALAGFWSEVLRLDDIGLHDDFFDLGGDSISATRVVARVNQRFGCALSAEAIFDNPTIARLCQSGRIPVALHQEAV